MQVIPILRMAQLKKLNQRDCSFILNQPMISADGKMIFTAHATSALLNQYLGLGLNGISEAIGITTRVSITK